MAGPPYTMDTCQDRMDPPLQGPAQWARTQVQVLPLHILRVTSMCLSFPNPSVEGG